MILSSTNDTNLDGILDQIGLAAALKKSKSALIKINLARPPEPGHPRTDPGLLAKVIQYLGTNGACRAIAEGANGFLQENIMRTGLEQVVNENNLEMPEYIERLICWHRNS